MPKPLLLEAAPAVAAQHGEDVGAAEQHRQLVVGDAAQEVHGRSRGGREALETGPIAPVAGDHDGEVRPLPGQPRRGLDQARRSPCAARAG